MTGVGRGMSSAEATARVLALAQDLQGDVDRHPENERVVVNRAVLREFLRWVAPHVAWPESAPAREQR